MPGPLQRTQASGSTTAAVEESADADSNPTLDPANTRPYRVRPCSRRDTPTTEFTWILPKSSCARWPSALRLPRPGRMGVLSTGTTRSSPQRCAPHCAACCAAHRRAAAQRGGRHAQRLARAWPPAPQALRHRPTRCTRARCPRGAEAVMNARRYPVRHSRDSRNVPLDFEAGQLHEQYELLGSGSRRTTPQPPTPIEELNQLADAHDRAGRNDSVNCAQQLRDELACRLGFDPETAPPPPEEPALAPAPITAPQGALHPPHRRQANAKSHRDDRFQVPAQGRR